MDVYSAILRRRTVRRYKPIPIPFHLLKKLVNAGRLAPASANLQPCEFIIVDEQRLREKIFSTLRWAGYIKPLGDPPVGERPMAYIIVLLNREKRKEGGKEDAAAAIENIILSAMEEGIATCWLGAIDRETIREILHIPEICEIAYVVALGYPNEEPIIEEDKDTIRYWKDDKGVLHVPKRPLDEVLYRNGYLKIQET